MKNPDLPLQIAELTDSKSSELWKSTNPHLHDALKLVPVTNIQALST